MPTGESGRLSIGQRVRRKLWWWHHHHYTYKWSEYKGKLALGYYNALYPNLRIGKNYTVWGNFYVTMYDPLRSQIAVGDNLHMVSDNRRAGIVLYSPCKLTTMGCGRIAIGNDVHLNGTVITCKKRVEIGDGALVAPNCIIVDSDFHTAWPPENRHDSANEDLDASVLIGKNTWLGMNVVVLKGVQIGDNSIIAAGSVVVSDIPENSLAAGVPAKVVKKLGT
jgi:acetyltransferase-like isoleucine patch superfamily enzyme